MSTSRPFIYADHAASTPLAPEAWEAMKPFLLDNFANPSSLYALSRPAKKALMAARETIAECLGAEPDEILFTSGGTESDNWALKGSIPLENAAGKTSFVTSKIEHHAVLRTCRAVEGMGVSVNHLPVNGQGEILPEVLKERISGDTRLVSVMLANNEIGTIQPIRELAEIAHAHGAVFHTDAVQAVGHIPVNVRELGVELLSASAHKFNGPRGAGFLYVKRGTPLTPYLDGGAQEFGIGDAGEIAAACLAELFDTHGVEHAIAALGGNVYARGTKPDGSPWRIGVQDPTDSSAYAGILSVTDAFAVTSGAYQRYFEQDGKFYHHIIDPADGYPADSGLASVTVVASAADPKHGAMCDAFSTALFVMGEEQAVEFWRGSGYDFDMILITEDGRLLATAGLESAFQPTEGGFAYEIIR